jgi:hypothetical protein
MEGLDLPGQNALVFGTATDVARKTIQSSRLVSFEVSLN